MTSPFRWQHLAASLLLVHALSACGGSDGGATASGTQPSAAAKAAGTSASAASKVDPEVRFAP